MAEAVRSEPLRDSRRYLVLAICCLSLLIVGLDTTIVNVALPAIHRSLRASVSGLQWTIDAYTLVLASFVILSGSMADRVGRRRIFQIGLVGFSTGSLLCGLAPSLTLLLIAAYFLFGVGSGLMNPPITNTAVSGMPGEQAGVAAAIASSSRQVGMTLGVAVIGAISGGILAGDIGKGFAIATHPGWWVIVGLGALIVLGGLVSTGARAERTARETAERFSRDPHRERRVRGHAAPELELS